MTSVRAAKSKGSSFEYDCQHSLKAKYPQIYRTSERGFQRQYDLCDENSLSAFECKRLKGISWNQLVGYYDKLEKVAGQGNNFLLFQSNRQPCLVFYKKDTGYTINLFETVFNVPFAKHPSTRVKVK
jgi:hypothetical protein